MRHYFLLFSLIVLLSSCCSNKENNSACSTKQAVDYVNPYMGNISHLLVPTYPTVHMPNSMLRVYPERADYTSDLINGLPVIVTSHRGSSAFNISPMQGDGKDLRAISSYSYDLEKITPYSYSVYLDEAHIKVNYAPSAQAAIYEISFDKKNGNNYLVVNTRNGEIQITDAGVAGYQEIGNNTKVYLNLETEHKPISIGILSSEGIDYNMKTAKGRDQAAVINFGPDQQTVRLRYGVSFISEEQAQKNLNREIAHYNWQEVAEAGRKLWNEVLGKIEIKGENLNDKTVFYTSLYRTYERMINISEDGRYFSAFDGNVHSDDGVPFYTDDWIWDTYRATHPLRVLIEPEMETAMINSYIRMANQNAEGWMPTFPEITGDSHRMNGNHAVAVVWDAYSKGLRGFDLKKAYQASKAAITESTLLPWVRARANKLDEFFREKGYFPALKHDQKEWCTDVHGWEKRQPVAVTLGAAYDDWCLSQIAKTLGLEEDYRYFLNRSYNYRNLFNPATAFFHPKDEDGNFITPFDYRYSGGMGARDYYDENNGWVYRWDVPHNVGDLVSLMGSPADFVKNLDATFREPLGKSKFDFYAQLPDHTGNVGQFSMANEPSLHIPYLYNYAGEPWKTQKRIRSLMKQWFRNDLMGVPGDEDGGGTSAFVVFSAMGFYPVTPGMPVYNIGSPLFSYVKIDLGKGNFFEIEAVNASDENKYIQSAKLNGKDWNKPWFRHEDIASGGKLVLQMGNKANPAWGIGEVPPSAEAFIE